MGLAASRYTAGYPGTSEENGCQMLGRSLSPSQALVTKCTQMLREDCCKAGSGFGGVWTARLKWCTARHRGVWFQQPGSRKRQCSVLCKGRSQSLASLSPPCWAGAPTKPDAGVPRSHTSTGSPPEMAAFLARAANRKEKLTALLIMPLQKESEPDKWDRKDDPDPLTGQFCRKFSTVSSNRQY